jgi:hypothetical protein
LYPESGGTSEVLDRFSWKFDVVQSRIYVSLETIDGASGDLFQTGTFSFDGVLGRSLLQARGNGHPTARVGSEAPTPIGSHLEPLALSGIRMREFGLPVYTVLAAASSVTYEGQEELDGVPCHRLVARGCQAGRDRWYEVRVWITASETGQMRRVEVTNEPTSDKTWRTVYTTQRFKPFTDESTGELVNFPVRGEIVAYNPEFEGPLSITRIEVETIEINVPLDQSDFLFDMPIGTRLVDAEGRTSIVGDGSDELARLRAEEAETSHSQTQPTDKPTTAHPPTQSLILPVVLGLIGVVLLLIVLSRRA